MKYTHFFDLLRFVTAAAFISLRFLVFISDPSMSCDEVSFSWAVVATCDFPRSTWPRAEMRPTAAFVSARGDSGVWVWACWQTFKQSRPVCSTKSLPYVPEELCPPPSSKLHSHAAAHRANLTGFNCSQDSSFSRVTKNMSTISKNSKRMLDGADYVSVW